MDYFFINMVLEVIKMSDIKIMCSYDKLVDPYELIENPKNPNRHPEKQIEILAKLIKSQGFRRPIVAMVGCWQRNIWKWKLCR